MNYGAFSVAFSASLAGLLWRDILGRKGIHVGSVEFIRTNVPIIAVSMMVGCAVLVGEVYVTRDEEAYTRRGGTDTAHSIIHQLLELRDVSERETQRVRKKAMPCLHPDGS